MNEKAVQVVGNHRTAGAGCVGAALERRRPHLETPLADLRCAANALRQISLRLHSVDGLEELERILVRVVVSVGR